MTPGLEGSTPGLSGIGGIQGVRNKGGLQPTDDEKRADILYATHGAFYKTSGSKLSPKRRSLGVASPVPGQHPDSRTPAGVMFSSHTHGHGLT